MMVPIFFLYDLDTPTMKSLFLITLLTTTLVHMTTCQLNQGGLGTALLFGAALGGFGGLGGLGGLGGRSRGRDEFLIIPEQRQIYQPRAFPMAFFGQPYFIPNGRKLVIR
jgi:hypothetical protein